MINIRINSKSYKVNPDMTILEACKSVGVYIPSLCYHEDLPIIGSCKLCIVKVDGKGFCYACATKVHPNMVINTQAEQVKQKSFEVFKEKLNCYVKSYKNNDIEDLFKYYYAGKPALIRKKEMTHVIKFIPEKCIDCNRCVSLCCDVLNIDALGDTTVSIKASPCVSCGLCANVCPTKAIKVRNYSTAYKKALAAGMKTILIVEPNVLSALEEALGKNKENQLNSAISKITPAGKLIGFKYVITSSAAKDFVIMKNAEKLFQQKSKKGEKKPLFSSYCPSFINFAEKSATKLINIMNNVANYRSHYMILARYLRNTLGDNIFIALLTSCAAVKDEIKQMQFHNEIDAVLSTTDFIKLLDEFGVEWHNLVPGGFDQPFNSISCESVLSATSGGFTEGVIRYLYHFHHQKSPNIYLSKTNDPNVKNILQLRNVPFNKSIKIDITINNTTYNMAVCNGIGVAREFIDSGEYRNYDFIEVATCPSGCIGGAGQPVKDNSYFGDIASERINDIYKFDNKFYQLDSIDKNVLFDQFESYSNRILEPQESVVRESLKFKKLSPNIYYCNNLSKSRIQGFARLTSGQLKCHSTPMMNIKNIDELLKYKYVIFFIESSRDIEGNITLTGQRFYNMLQKFKGDMSTLEYILFSVGDKTCGEKFDSILKAHNAKEMLPMQNASFKDCISVYSEWSLTLSKIVYASKPKIGFILLNEFSQSKDKSVIDKPARPIGFEIAKLKERKQKDNGEMEYIIQLPSGMTYDDGDHICILPQNCSENIENAIKALNLDPSLVLELENNNQDILNYIPAKTSIKQLFTQFIDLHCPPTKALISTFYESSNEQGKKLLTKFAGEFEQNQNEKPLNVLKFLLDFAPYGIPSNDKLISALPKIKPRYYSIESSQDTEPEIIRINVLEVEINIDGKTLPGLSTGFLKREDTVSVPIKIHHGTLKLPKDDMAPLIMVGLGGGISSMISLMRNRLNKKQNNQKIGDAILFYGCRYESSNKGLIYKFNKYKQQGVIKNFFIAYSQEFSKKHIQDLFKENAEIIWDLWQDVNTKLYYCGHQKKIKDELEDILVTITCQQGWLSIEEGMAVNHRHEFFIETI